jgi:hypothetical protein
MLRLYEAESEREAGERVELARLVGLEVARLLLPAWGFELKVSRAPSPETPGRFIEIVVDGKRRKVREPPHGWVYDKAGRLTELKPSEGYPIGDTGLKTQASPRIIGGSPNFDDCEHLNHVPYQGQLKCLDCGSVGN